MDITTLIIAQVVVVNGLAAAFLIALRVGDWSITRVKGEQHEPRKPC